jgi:hypothetical protein
LGRRLNPGRGWPGWAFAMAVAFGTLGLLFPPPFVLRVVVPFFEAL